MKKYTLGFVFNPDYSEVLLVTKNRPSWQAGKLNGIGGHIEEGETSLECIVREIQEETALRTKGEDWSFTGSMGTDTFNVDSYTMVYEGDMADARTTTDEEITWYKVNDLPKNILSSLSWLVQAALDKHKNNSFDTFRFEYNKDAT